MKVAHRPRFCALAFLTAIILAGLLLAACEAGRNGAPKTAEFEPEILPLPAQLATYENMPIPEDNPMTPEKVALGRQLFFDKRLSADGTRSCYSCHVCEKGLTDGLAKAVGALNKQLPRSSPTLWNIGYHKNGFYWDGRSPSLEKQALAAWTGANMSANAEEVAAKLNGIPGYQKQFQQVFGSKATPDNIVKAIAAFERTIISDEKSTPFDRWRSGDESAVNDDAKKGWQIFQDLKCTNCHDTVLFTDQQYHNVGIGTMAAEPDVGRFKVTNNPKDTGAFKTPTLRDVAQSAPYFHDGSVGTLEEAVDLMVGGGIDNPHLDRVNLKKQSVTPEQKRQLLEFLKSLDVDCKLSEPKLP